jgi:ribonuclease Z
MSFALIFSVALISGGGFFFQKQMGLAIERRAVDRGFEQRTIDLLPDELHAGLCGSGAPLPDPNRAGPCVVVVAARKIYIVDAGVGSARKVGLMGMAPGQIDGIFLTHFHSDHIGGLGEMMLQRWTAAGHSEPVDVYGPEGVESVVDGFNAAYKLDSGYRVAHHGAATIPSSGSGGTARPFAAPSDDGSVVVLERDGLTVRAFSVRHTPVVPAVGYRFEYRGRSIVISGDTAPSESLEKNAKGADILFHEGLQTTMVSILHDSAARHGQSTLAKITGDIPSYHTTPEDAAKIAERAGVRRLVFYHIIPALPFSYLEGAFLGDAAKFYHGSIVVGRDGLLLSLPAGGTSISMRELL